MGRFAILKKEDEPRSICMLVGARPPFTTLSYLTLVASAPGESNGTVQNNGTTAYSLGHQTPYTGPGELHCQERLELDFVFSPPSDLSLLL